MSWDTVYDRLEKSSCACGNGSVFRHSYMRMDDWNRTDDGISDIPFLVPIGMTLKHDVSSKYFNFGLDENIVSSYEKSNIQAVIDDMSTNKYSTRLALDDSRDIVSLYYKHIVNVVYLILLSYYKSVNQIMILMNGHLKRCESIRWKNSSGLKQIHK